MKKTMKKGIALGLVVLLLIAVAGTVFADSFRNYEFNNGGMEGLYITNVDVDRLDLSITYRADEAYGRVRFTFTAYLQTGKTQTWTNTEFIYTRRSSSTWTFSSWQASFIDRLVISAERL